MPKHPSLHVLDSYILTMAPNSGAIPSAILSVPPPTKKRILSVWVRTRGAAVAATPDSDEGGGLRLACQTPMALLRPAAASTNSLVI